MDELINQFNGIDNPDKWYEWVSQVNALPDPVAGDLFKRIGINNISTKRDQFATKK